MKSRGHSRSSAAFALALPLLPLALLFAADVHAQADAKANANMLNQMFAAECPTFADKLIGMPELKLVQRERPIDIAAVCACTAKGFVADRRLQEQLETDGETLKARVKSERMTSYMTGRLLSSVLSCMVPELEATLSASSPQ